MKRAAEVKPLVRCSEEPVAGDGSICAVSITKRAKLEEPEAADGVTRRSPEPLAADSANIAKKRARKSEEPSKKEKGAKEKGEAEKSKRSKKKRAEEKNKQPNKVEVVHDFHLSMEKIMAELAEEKSKRSKREKRIEEMSMRIEKIASVVEEPKVGDVADREVIREMMDNEAGGMMKKKKKVVTWTLSQELLDYLRTKEVMGLLATEAPLEPWASKMAGPLFDQRLKEDIAAEFQKNREFDAHVLYQYRTYGCAEIKEEVSDKEDDVEADEKP